MLLLEKPNKHLVKYTTGEKKKILPGEEEWNETESLFNFNKPFKK